MNKRVRMAAETHQGIDRGVSQIVAAIRPSLGPLPRAVAVQRPDHAMLPELLDDGAAIARRIVALPDEGESAGAMYLRGFLWRLHEEVGDGTATAATLFGSFLAAGRQALAAGVSAQQLRPRLEAVAKLLRADLAAQALPPGDDREHLARVAKTVCHDDELADLLGDIFDVAGAFGQIAVLPSQRRESWREFVQGSYWKGGAHSPLLLNDQIRLRSDLIEPALALTSLDLDDPREIAPALETAFNSGAGGLIVIAKTVSEQALSMLRANSRPDFPIVAVKPPGFGDEAQRAALQDLAVLTGGRVFWGEAGDRLGLIRMAHLGRTRTAWVDPRHFGIVSGQGDAREIRMRIKALTAYFDQCEEPAARDAARLRLHAFHGVAATLWVGGDSDIGAKNRLETANRAVRILRAAIRDGSVPGGGAALLTCRANLNQRLAKSTDEIKRAALRIVVHGLEDPFRTILANCGFETAAPMAAIARGQPGLGFNVLTGEIVDMRAAGILDPLAVITAATVGAIRSVALALTIDTMVHTRSTDISVNPE